MMYFCCPGLGLARQAATGTEAGDGSGILEQPGDRQAAQ